MDDFGMGKLTIEYAARMTRDIESINAFWSEISDKASEGLKRELDGMCEAHLEHVVKDHLYGRKLIGSEGTLIADQYKEVFVFMLAGLYALNRYTVPRLYGDLIDSFRRECDSHTEASGRLQKFLSSIGGFRSANKQFIECFQAFAARGGMCQGLCCTGYIYALGVAWLKAMQMDGARKELISNTKTRLERINAPQTSSEVKPGLMTELEEVLKGVKVSTEADSL